MSEEIIHRCSKCTQVVPIALIEEKKLKRLISQRRAIAKRKAAGLNVGRKRTVDRERAIELLNKGLSCTEIAKAMGVSRQSISYIKNNHEDPFNERDLWLEDGNAAEIAVRRFHQS